MLRNRLKALTKAKENHRVNIQKSLEHRLEVAREKGDTRLINQLEAEMKYFG